MKILTLSVKIKLAVALSLAVLCGVVVLQNTQTVETRILFMSLTMPRAALLFGTTAIGFAVGVLSTLILKGRPKADN